MHFNDDKDNKAPKKKWEYNIKHWYGRAREGVWIPEAIATNVKRVFERHTKGKGWTKAEPVIVKEKVEELIYAHHGYRPRMEGEKQTRKAFFFRGARVWRK